MASIPDVDAESTVASIEAFDNRELEFFAGFLALKASRSFTVKPNDAVVSFCVVGRSEAGGSAGRKVDFFTESFEVPFDRKALFLLCGWA